MWLLIVIGIVAFFLLVVLEGGLGEWADWAWRRNESGQFSLAKRVSQLVLIALLIGFCAWIVLWHWPAHKEFYSW